ncbi:MAG: helix-turn-helix domain-containing protein [Actinomycetota bacterium]
MGSTIWNLGVVEERPFLKASGTPLEAFLDGLKRVVFVEERSDLKRLVAGDLVVALGAVAGRDVDSLERLADNLENLGAVGLLVHERFLREIPSDLPRGTGEFPVMLVPRETGWTSILQPLLHIDSRLRESGNAELQRRELVTKLLDREPQRTISRRKAKEAGLDPSGSYRAFVVTAAGSLPNKVRRRLEEVIATELLEYDPLGTVVVIDEHIVAIEGRPSAPPDALGGRLLLRAREVPTFEGNSIGIGDHHEGLDGIILSFREARWAALVGHRLGGSNEVMPFAELGAYAWLEPLDHGNGDRSLAAILTLLEHDRGNDTKLVETLRTCLESRRIKDAADRLFVHRNTLRYRLDSIRKLTGLNVQESDGRLILELQLRLAIVRGLLPTMESRPKRTPPLRKETSV